MLGSMAPTATYSENGSDAASSNQTALGMDEDATVAAVGASLPCVRLCSVCPASISATLRTSLSPLLYRRMARKVGDERPSAPKQVCQFFLLGFLELREVVVGRTQAVHQRPA